MLDAYLFDFSVEMLLEMTVVQREIVMQNERFVLFALLLPACRKRMTELQ